MFTQSLAHWASAYEERINNNYTPEEIINLRGEAAAAKALGIPWEQRGPKGPMEGGPASGVGRITAGTRVYGQIVAVRTASSLMRSTAVA